MIAEKIDVSVVVSVRRHGHVPHEMGDVADVFVRLRLVAFGVCTNRERLEVTRLLQCVFGDDE